MINLSYNDFYEKMSQSVNEFNLVDNFSFNKRNLLVTNAETINEYFKKEGISSEQIYRLEKLQQKMIQRAEGGVVSNLFLKFLGNGEGLKELRDRSLQIAHEIKKINKLLKGANNTNFLPSFLSVEGKKLDKLLFDDHIYERMIHFGHTFKLNEDGVVVFKFSERTSLDDEVVESSIDEIEDPDTYWEELHEEFLEKGFVLEVRGEFENGLYREISASEITSAQLKEIIVQEDGSFNQDIHVIYPTQNLTVEELEERCVLDKDEETGEYLINSEYQYLQDGFRDYPYERWDHLRPYGHTLNKPKDFLIDIIVHSRPDLPGVFIDQGHVSVKMTTPNGEVYSLGFYPEDSERHPYDLRMQKGDLVTPDHYLFMPSNSYRQHHLKYNLSDPKAFHKLIQWVEAVQGYNKDEETGEVHSANLFYHPTHHSCSVFASALRDRAIELGAKPQSLSRRKISNLTTVFSRFKEWLLNFFITNPLGRKKFQWDQGVEFGGIKNYNITHLDPKGLYLPLDLILDHQKLVSKK